MIKDTLLPNVIPIFLMGMLIVSGIGSIAVSDENSIKIQQDVVHFSEPLIEKDTLVQIQLPDANGFRIEQDKPLFPKETRTYIFPSDTRIHQVDCTPCTIKTRHIVGDFLPSPQMIALRTQSPIETGQKQYHDSQTYPHEWFDADIGCGIQGNERVIIIKIDLYPVRYDASQELLSWVESFEIDIQYSVEESYPTLQDEYDLLLLAPDQFATELQTLVDHKINRGISTTLVTLEDIIDEVYFPLQGRDEIEQIKYFIKSAIESWGITNVLLVGGASELPARETHVFVGDSDDEIFVSDLYYADIYVEEMKFSSWDTNENDIFAEYNWDGETDEIDFYPDVKIGRLACINTQQVNTVVNKIIAYETNRAYTENWFNNIVVIGGDTVPRDNSNTDEGERVNQFVLDRMQGFIPEKIWDSNGRLSGFTPTGVIAINDAINAGCGFVDFSGHGAPWVWTTFPHNGTRQSLPTPTGSYTNTIIDELSNGHMLPIVVNGGCSLGKYQENDNCNAWAFVANPNGGGIASFGATGLGYVYVGEYVTEGLVEGLNIDIFEAYRDGAMTFGDMYVDGINIYITGNLGDGDHKTLMEWHAFGDPTLQIRETSTPPVKPATPSGPSSGTTGEEYEYTSTSTDPDGDSLFYLFDWGDGSYSGWIGLYQSGESASSNHVWSERGNYQVRVRSKDVNGVQSEWSDPLPISMPKQKDAQILYIWDILEQILEVFPSLTSFFFS